MLESQKPFVENEKVLAALTSVNKAEQVKLELPIGMTKKTVRLTVGIPVKEKESGRLGLDYDIDDPHLFTANRIQIWDPELPSRIDVELTDVNVLTAHGYRYYGAWKFGNGQDVIRTVMTYNSYASLNNLPLIDLIDVCNEADGHGPRDRSSWHADELRGTDIAYPKEGKTSGSSMINDRGEVDMRTSSHHRWENLHKLYRKKTNRELDDYVKEKIQEPYIQRYLHIIDPNWVFKPRS